MFGAPKEGSPCQYDQPFWENLVAVFAATKARRQASTKVQSCNKYYWEIISDAAVAYPLHIYMSLLLRAKYSDVCGVITF